MKTKRTNKTQKLHEFLLTLPKDGYPPCNRRNGRPADGWTYGCYRLTVAIKNTGLPYDNYWSGRAPTPSTQYPKIIYDAAKNACLLD